MRSRKSDLTGTITAIAYPGAGPWPSVRVSLRTKDGQIGLTFLGRTDVHCIEIGSRLRVKGALVTRDGVPTLFNPAYTVLTGEEGHV